MRQTTKKRMSRRVKPATGDRARNRFAKQGYRLFYHPEHVNVCPGCGGSSWWVGRITAECANEQCGLALDIKGADVTNSAVATIVARRPKVEEFIHHNEYSPRIQPMEQPRGLARWFGRFA